MPAIHIKIGAISISVLGGNKILTASDFTSGVYTNSSLVGLTPMIDFNLFSNDGSGTLLTVGISYTFDATTGAITLIPAQGGNYLLLI